MQECSRSGPLRPVRVVGDAAGVRPVFAVLLSLCLVAVAPDVRADDAAESRFFDRLGRRAFEARRWDDALEAFLRAQRAAPSVRGLYNVALCAQLAHEDTLAFTAFEELLVRPDVDDALRTDASRQRDVLARTLALVHVVSDPPGAAIYVDQRDLGSFGTTPTTLALAAGAHTIELVRADHEDARMTVEATVGVVREASVALTPQLGRLRIDVSSSAVSIVARHGEVEIPLTPGAVSSVPVGSYVVVATAPGREPASVEVVVTATGEERRTLTLVETPIPHGRLLVSTEDVRARVRIDGVDRAETPARVEVPVGVHEIRVTADGWLDWSGEVTVEEGRTAFVSVTLVRSR